MLNSKIVLFLLALFFAPSFEVEQALGLEEDHKFYYSRTTMRPSRQGYALEIEMRIFTDDLELAIDRENELTRLGTLVESNDANFRIEDYIRSNFGIYINDQFTDYRFFGKEVDFDITYCYMEASIPHDIYTFEVQNTILMEFFPSQVNEIDVRLNGTRKRLMLTYEWPSELINY